MLRYKLRTLLMVLALGPMVLAWAYSIRPAMDPAPAFLTDEDFPDFIPPRGWSLKLQMAVQRKVEADRAAGHYPLSNNRP